MSMMIRRGVARAAKAAPVITYAKDSVEEPIKKPVTTDAITKEEVEKMPYFGLKALAQKHDIDVEGKKAAKLKEELIKKLDL